MRQKAGRGRAPGGASAQALGGDELRGAFQAATLLLERYRDAINALNVFPVPDGDTGTNMLLTMRSVNEESARVPGSSAGPVMVAMAHGALLGARGNSGVILSQFFHGLAQGLQGKDTIKGEDLAQALALASTASYSSVSKPVDGTMLTVIRELSLAASRHVGSRGGNGDVLSLWWVALEAAKHALSRTPMQLPVLREAGVVDAGGQGLVTLLEGAWYHLAGQELDGAGPGLCDPVFADGSAGEASPSGPLGRHRVQQEYLAATEGELYGYCTQLLIQGHGLQVDGIREHLSAMADSTVVVGSEALVKVHLHTHDPGPTISYAVSLGTVTQVSMDNIDQQHQEFLSLHRDTAEAMPLAATADSHKKGPAPQEGRKAVVAVAWGEGLVHLFEGLGCAKVVEAGQTMNPSTRELLDAARSTGAAEVILLPNNPNIIPAARQAAALAPEVAAGPTGQPAQAMALHVILSRSIPQGVAGLLAFNPEEEVTKNLESMESSLSTVRTMEVTRAVRAASLGGLPVKEGQYIGLLEGELVSAGDTVLSVLEETLSLAGPARGQLVTLYWGADLGEQQAREAAARIQETMLGVDVEVLYGGQPYYQFIASLE